MTRMNREEVETRGKKHEIENSIQIIRHHGVTSDLQMIPQLK